MALNWNSIWRSGELLKKTLRRQDHLEIWIAWFSMRVEQLVKVPVSMTGAATQNLPCRWTPLVSDDHCRASWVTVNDFMRH
jgi:hypothetical protein